MKKIKILSIILTPTLFLIATPSISNIRTVHIDQKKILANAPQLSPKALQYGIKAYNWASKSTGDRSLTNLAVQDNGYTMLFNRPSISWSGTAKKSFTVTVTNGNYGNYSHIISCSPAASSGLKLTLDAHSHTPPLMPQRSILLPAAR